MQSSRVFTLIAGVALGATATALLDPRSGRRRRALVRDKARHSRRMMRMAWRRPVRRLRGSTRGMMHTMTTRAPWYDAPPPPDRSQFIKDRVESELGRERSIPFDRINIDVVDGIVRLRGTVPDEATAAHAVKKAAAVDGVCAVQSLLHTSDGTLVGGEAGDTSLLHGEPRAAVIGDTVRRQLLERWPELTDADILACAGHVGKLADIVCQRTGESPATVRAALDGILLAAV